MAGEFEIQFAFEGEEYKLPTLMLAEARAIQKVTGYTVKRFFESLAEMDAEAITALIWVARKRGNPTLRFDDVDGDLSTFAPIGGADEEDEAEQQGKDPDPSPTDAGLLAGEA